MENSMSPGEISFIGAVAVTFVYMLHRLALGLPAVDMESGFFLTILVSAFLAQYVPLNMWKNRAE